MAAKHSSPLASEEALARRITYERERRHWSPGGLARLMTKAGCPMNQSAIWKIEKGEPRRKITVDEAVTFAKVFDTNLEELLVPPELSAEADVLNFLSKYAEHFEETTTAFSACSEIADELEELLSTHPEIRDKLGRRVGREEVSLSHGKVWGALLEASGSLPFIPPPSAEDVKRMTGDR